MFAYVDTAALQWPCQQKLCSQKKMHKNKLIEVAYHLLSSSSSAVSRCLDGRAYVSTCLNLRWLLRLAQRTMSLVGDIPHSPLGSSLSSIEPVIVWGHQSGEWTYWGLLQVNKWPWRLELWMRGKDKERKLLGLTGFCQKIPKLHMNLATNILVWYHTNK